MPETIYHRRHLLTTVGATSLIFLAAFESLAVTTVMPIITADLGGRSVYSLGFAATLAAGAVGMVTGGALADRRGPAQPLLVAIAVFGAGLAVAGLAGNMPVFIAGRFLQGLGSGAFTVALYVLVARLYPADLHPRLFGLFAAAWVVPSLVGPFAAGVVADALSWHWVFLGVLALVVAVTLLILPAVRALPPVPPAALDRRDLRRMAAALVVALSVVGLSLAGNLPAPFVWPSAAVAVIAVLLAVRPLLPEGTLRAVPGLPATILTIGGAGAAFFGTEAYLPLLLQDRYGWPAWLSGAFLTGAALSWAFASDVQGRVAAHASHRTVIRTGSVLLAVGVLTVLVTAGLALHPLVAGLGWVVAGGGMGLMYPRISTAVLAASAEESQGFNTAAKTIADSVAGSSMLAVTGLIFHSLSGVGSFVGALGLTAVAGAATVFAASRVAKG